MPGENDETTAADLIEEVLPDGDAALAALAEETELPKPPKSVSEKLSADRKAVDAEARKRDREAGRVSVMDAYEKRAKALGYSSMDEMFKAGGQPKPSTQPKPGQVQGESAELVRLQAENKTLQNRIRGLQSRIDALQSDMELRQVAYEADINPEEIDYALHQMQHTYKRLDAEEAKSFDPKKYLGVELKAKKPGVFRQALTEARKVEEQPVSNTPEGTTPKGPTATETRQVAAGAQPSARVTGLSHKEYQERMRAKGIRDPATHV